jgi:mitotic-spindle organizing protein 1
VAVLWEVAQLLNTGLDRESLFLCIQLCELNVNPEALAAVVKELRREAQAVPAAVARRP